MNNISYAPHIRHSTSVKNIMLMLLAAAGILVVPALFVYGARVIALVLFAVAGAVLPEILFSLIKKEKETISDFSALYIAVLTALLMPSGVPVWIPFAAGAFGAIAAKLPFGRLGRSPFSPAAAGFVFVSLAWGEYFVCYPKIGEKLPFLNNWSLAEGYEITEHQTAIQILQSAQKPYFSNEDAMSAIFGFKAIGPIGAIGVLIILVSLAFMIFRKISAWQSTAAFCAVVILLSMIFRYDGVSVLMAPVYELFTGWMLLVAVFLAGDILTAPRLGSARVLYGIACGILAFILRRISAIQGGEITAVLIVNALSSAIDRLAWNCRQRGISLTAMKEKIKYRFEKSMKQFED